MSRIDPYPVPPGQPDPIASAYAQGRRNGLATAALAIGIVSFITLLGLEKAALAITLGLLAVRHAAPGTRSRQMGLLAIALGVIFILTVGVVLVLFRDRFAEFIRLLQQLS